ncbi:hypothetical protein [Aliiglaciecola litoralis]|uniref:HDOD domain-containing protein n=1 Tax=Aliiglaciecola litoralis TaxID=582857 RepID=A0ABN1LJR4_9ALTE
MPTQVVVKQFARIAGIIKDVNNHPLNSTQIQPIVKAAELFLNGFNHTPDIFSAQPYLYKSKYSYIDNLTFNSLVFCALLCKQNKVNELCSQQMLSSIISLYAERAALLTQYYQQQGDAVTEHPYNKALITLLQKVHLDVWYQGYGVFQLLCKEPSAIKKWPAQLTRVQRMVLCAHWLAVGVTHRTSGKSLSFAACLRQLTQLCPQHWINDLQPLLEYPGLVPPGTVIKYSGGQNAIVLGVTSERLLVNKLSKDKDQPVQFARVYKTTEMQPLGAQVIKGFSQTHNWWSEQWQAEKADCISPISESYPLNKPPPVLLEVQTHLNSGEVDIDKLAVQISAEPAFSEYLKRTATFSNRNKIPVQQVKHGLMMHGYLRTNNMLIEQALLLRLNQSYFPLQQDFTQFTRLVAQIAFNLASHGNDITPEQASNLACFACSGLFTQPRLKTRTHWSPAQQNHYDLRSLYDFSHTDSLIEHGLILCKAWQQPGVFITAIQHLSTPPNELKQTQLAKCLTCILGLSILAAKRAFFANLPQCTDSDNYINQALEILAMSPTDYQHLSEQSLTQTHCYRTFH